MACNRIKDAIESVPDNGDRPIQAVLDAYNPIGSTAHVRFNTSKQPLWDTAPNKSHVNWVVYDSQWEAEFCRVVEAHPRVRSYVKNQGLGFEVPYLYGSTQRKYIPDFILQIDDGRDDLLNLIVEIKGFRGEDAKDKANTMKTYWIPGVNSLGKFGRWAFAEFTSVFEIDSDFHKLIETLIL
jgi:type III restriction enzyme